MRISGVNIDKKFINGYVKTLGFDGVEYFHTICTNNPQTDFLIVDCFNYNPKKIYRKFNIYRPQLKVYINQIHRKEKMKTILNFEDF